jgi:hypothetical protein
MIDRLRLRDDRGSIMPLILGCWMLVMLIVAGFVAGTDAFDKLADLQDTCDGAAAAAAATAADLDRDIGLDSGTSLRFAGVQDAVDSYLARDAYRSSLTVQARLSADARTLTLACAQTSSIAFGWLFARDHVTHRVASSARAPVRG